ncbi:MAG: metalloregulator ArsR/SmtB family transcription factor [bacterium]|nr:metalloregulator ArsR/SmtB family transcription factor [bacterium]
MDTQRLAHIFKILSVDNRLRIIQLLKDHAPLCVGAISAQLEITQGAVSQHLRLLRDANLVVAEKRGYYMHYRLNWETLALWWKDVTEHLLGVNLGVNLTGIIPYYNGSDYHDANKEEKDHV